MVFGLVTDALKGGFGDAIDEALLVLLGIAALGALATRLIAPQGPSDSLFGAVFRTSWPWVAMRLLGFAVVACVYFDAGPVLLRLPDTGITVVNDIGHNVLMIYLGGLLLMPLLTEYGLMEFAGTLCRPLFRSLFRLPGRAAVDSLTSIAAAAGIGVLVTISQYQRGYYSAREAATIACNFSLVSIPFSLLMAQVAKIDHLFFGWYFAVLVTTVLCAAVLARLPPLARIADRYIDGSAATPVAAEASGGLAAAWTAARRRAATGPGVRDYLVTASRNFAVTTCGVLGPSLATATIAAMLLFHSPVITTLTTPLAQLLSAVGVADAAAIASAVLIGFLDQFLPTLVAAQLGDPLWRFVLAGLGVCQLVYMAEIGVLLLRSPLPIGMGTLFLVFLLRTALSLPVLLAFGMLLAR
ncbi:MAG: nucleoside recognition domain-containing protein [Pseudomonadota bacterium]